ncbi:glycosyltransferase family 2 protein, partial [Candidatus Roizmanbacteria bacterium]|nr:glycosyltransferase family 2 protein [Candidatus Roizmanbacteria bacterium]
MKLKLSLLMISKNAEQLLEKSLQSSKGLVDEIIMIDNYSKDRTCEIAKKYRAKIYQHKENDLGKQRAYGLKKVTGDWVLVLDADEILSEELKREIVSLFHGSIVKKNGYLIPFQSHFLGKPVNHGGENYKKLWLFRKDAVVIDSALVHERFALKKGKIGELKHKIYHYSYRSFSQTFRKFTDYAVREAKQKIRKGEKTGLKKIILYPLHMFWSRFIEDKGYKDGIFRIPLDLGFAYMEFLTYFMMIFFERRREEYGGKFSTSS